MSVGRKPETDVVKRALDLLHSRYGGSRWWRQNSGRVKVRGGWLQLGEQGMPDIIGVQQGGQAALCEVKRKKGRLTQEQWDTLTEMQRRGALALVYIEDTLYHLANVPEGNLP